MSTIDHSATAEVSADPRVPAYLPPSAPPPEPARPITFLRTLALFCLRPQTCGPHLAAGPLRNALAAHMLALAFVVFAMIVCLAHVASSSASERRGARRVVAGFIIDAASQSYAPGWKWATPPALIGYVALTTAITLVLATLATPWLAAGDWPWSAWKRSVKLAFWATTVLIPAAIVFTVAFLSLVQPPSSITAGGFVFGTRHSQFGEDAEFVLFMLIPGGTGLLLLSTFLLAGRRYVGAADGPAFSVREPRCDECGYRLVGLPVDSNCPECGTPVRDSLPGGRRRGAGRATYELRPRNLWSVLKLHWSIVHDADFFRRIPLADGVAAARRFFWASYLLMAVIAMVVFEAVATLATLGDAFLPYVPLAVLWFLIFPLLVHAAATCVCCIWGQFRYGIRDYRVSGCVCCYAVPLMWPANLAVLIALSLFPLWSSDTVSPSGTGPPFDAPPLFLIACAIVLVVALSFWWLRLCAALRGVRFAVM